MPMSVFVWISDQCRKDAVPQNYLSQLEKLQARIEQEQHLGILDRFPPPFLKKRFERQIRLVAKEFRVGQDTLVVFLRLIVRGDREYLAFCESSFKTLPKANLESSEYEQSNLERLIRERRSDFAPNKLAPSDAERTFLLTAMNRDINIYRDYHVCETALWTEKVKEHLHHLNKIPEKLFTLIDETEEAVHHLKIQAQKPYTVVCRIDPKRRQLFLLYPSTLVATQTPQAPWTGILDSPEPLETDLSVRYAKRAYPLDLVLDEEAWYEVQKESEGNMALSYEEVEVLESVRSTGDQRGFPLFINGRAGSGKSTVLQYLYAEILKYCLATDQTLARPAYFACNQELLDRARANVSTVLRSTRLDISRIPSYSESFHEFHSFLMDLVPEKHRPTKLFTYANFREWWDRSFGKAGALKRAISCDLAWHVIRTYFKGLYADEKFEPDDYVDIPMSQKSVSEESLRAVYDTVFPKYQELLDQHNWWDQQDLARHVLDNELVVPTFSAIVCDEAQDFTRLELEILHRLSIFSDRRLFDHEIRMVPYAFAGDPFQTLNPTGFKWDATKTFFVEKFGVLPGGDSLFNYKELTYNYRSNPQIVLFCNSLQLARSNIFKLPEITPQVPWSEEANAPQISYFEWEDRSTRSLLQAQGEVRIIVPCSDGEEIDYVRNSDLRHFVECDEEGVPRNVVSATRVKGLEFPRVVLFGFGDGCPEALKKALSQESALLLDDMAIEPQYYLNKLYVASSRPRKRLIIVDTKQGIDSFWQPLFSDEQRRQRWSRGGQTADWSGQTGSIRLGTREDWEADRENPIETAKALYAEGVARADRVLLRQAAQSFRAAQRDSDAKDALARAFSIEGNHLRAGELFEELGSDKDSLLEYWKAGNPGQPKIMALGVKFQNVRASVEFRLVRFVREKEGMMEALDLFDACHERFKEDRRALSLAIREPLWMKSFSECLERLRVVESTHPTHWRNIGANLRDLASLGLFVPKLILGLTAYQAGDMHAALQDWKDLHGEDAASIDDLRMNCRLRVCVGEEFRSALESAIVRKDPDLERVRAALVRAGEEPELDRSDYTTVMLKASLHVRDWRKAEKYTVACTDVDAVLTILLDYGRVGSHLASVAVSKIWDIVIKNEDGKEVVDWARGRRFRNKSLNQSHFQDDRWKDSHYDRLLEHLTIDTALSFLNLEQMESLADLLFERLKTYANPLKKREVSQFLNAIGCLGYYNVVFAACEHVEVNCQRDADLRRLALDIYVNAKLAAARRAESQGDSGRASNLRKDAERARERGQIVRGDHVAKGEQGEEGNSERVKPSQPTKTLTPAPVPPPEATQSVQTHAPREVTKRFALDATLFGVTKKVGPWQVKVSPDGKRVNVELKSDLTQGHFLPQENQFVYEGVTVLADGVGVFRMADPFLEIDASRRTEGHIVVYAEGGSSHEFRIKKVLISS